MQGTEGMLLTSTVLLLGTVCAVLDDNASTGLLSTFSSLLEGVPTLKTCTRVGDSHGLKDFAVSVPQGPWVARYKSESAWIQVCGKLLPALVGACEALASGSQKEQQQNGIFRDVAVSAWTCCNPGCTNMAGLQEASLALSKCAGCGEARYCSRRVLLVVEDKGPPEHLGVTQGACSRTTFTPAGLLNIHNGLCILLPSWTSSRALSSLAGSPAAHK